MHHRWSFLRIVCCLVLCIAANQLLCPVVAAAPVKLSDLAQAAFVELKLGVTPSQWKVSHPTDEIEAAGFSGDYEPQGGWCVRFLHHFRLNDGVPAARYALFYPPSVPSGAVPSLPNREDKDLVARSCTLGAIWIEIDVRDVRDADGEVLKAMNAAARDDLSRKWGQPNPVFEFPALIGDYPSPWHLSHWEASSIWTRDSKTVLLAFTPGYLNPPETSFTYVPARAIAYVFWGNGLAAAPWAKYVPSSDSQSDARWGTPSTVAAAAALTNLDAGLTQAILSDTTFDHSRNFDNVVPVLQQWMAKAQGLPQRARAAALLIADRVVAAANPGPLGWEDIAGDQSIRDLQLLGAKFVNFKDGPGYAENWLEEAKALDPGGPVAELVDLTELLEGCRPQDAVVDSPPGASSVDEPTHSIALGEEILKEFPQDQWTASVEFIVADTAEGQLALSYPDPSLGYDPYYFDSTSSPDSPKSQQFRALAISHYRAALKLESDTARARAAWGEAWRLLAGLPPSSQDLKRGCQVE
jgi:hypothetical protein